MDITSNLTLIKIIANQKHERYSELSNFPVNELAGQAELGTLMRQDIYISTF